MNSNKASRTSNQSKAIKDCRTCNRRRIKCDRSTPVCKKCASKNLECPGYGIILNWEWGVASRGRFARKAIPTSQPVNTSPSRLIESPASLLSISRETSENGDICRRSPSFDKFHSPGESADLTELGKVVTTLIDYQPPLCLEISPTMTSSSGLLQDNISRRLFSHYSQAIAANMVWVDSPENKWRTTLMPMAFSSTPLLMSILGFAAEHLSATLPKGSILADNLSSRARNYRDSALSLLASDMRSVAMPPEASEPRDSKERPVNDIVNSMLASMLVLCNMETVRPDSRIWRVHLDAARTVATIQINSPSPKDSTFNFLVEQLFIFEAFACTTSFVQLDSQDVMVDNSSIFTEFLRLVRKVTWLERQAKIQGQPISGANIPTSSLCAMFEDARNHTTTLCANTAFSTNTEREQFLGVVDSFHHAGLLYSYRCLAYPDVEEEVARSRAALFQSLDLVQSDHPALAQNVFWPLFIAGTEARNTDGTREMVEVKLKQAMRRTGFSNCEVALAFLKVLWSARDQGQSFSSSSGTWTEQPDQSSSLNWIHFARYWTSQGNQFLVY